MTLDLPFVVTDHQRPASGLDGQSVFQAEAYIVNKVKTLRR